MKNKTTSNDLEEVNEKLKKISSSDIDELSLGKLKASAAEIAETERAGTTMRAMLGRSQRAVGLVNDNPSLTQENELNNDDNKVAYRSNNKLKNQLKG